MLSKLAGVIPKLLIFYFVFRVGDLIYRGALGHVLEFDLKSIMFIIENLLYIYPIVILFSAAKRKSPKYLFLSAVSMLLAGALYRFNTYLIGFNPGNGYVYFPSFSEILITVGIIAMELMAYLVFVKTMPVLPQVKHAQ